jgi:drug/metabolite transporter (DMT)-like permease
VTRPFGLVLGLIAIGGCWGLTVPLSKIAITGGFRAPGMIFWSSAIAVVLLGVLLALRRSGLPLHRGALRTYAFVALFGTLLSSAASYTAAIYLPAGIIALCLSFIPMMALPLAVALGIDNVTPGRLAGLLLGLAGVLMMVLPEASLPDRAMAAFLPLALLAPLCYAIEAAGLGRMGAAGLGPMQVLFGASVLSCAVAMPVALATGTFISPLPPYGAPELAVLLSGVINALTYAAYVWMVGRAGAVFAAQVSYVVTGFGILWSMLLLAESYSIWVWAAMAAVFGGLFLVQPRLSADAESAALVPAGPVANIPPDTRAEPK